jgi:alginate O-acetyltransferase complex protein AlgI
MLFHSPGFLFIFLPLIFLFIAVAPLGLPRAIGVLFFSLLFYAGNEPRFVFILIFSSLVDYFIALAIAESSSIKQRRFYLAISITTNLGLLAFFKYGGMIAVGLNPMLSYIGFDAFPENFEQSFVLPSGISFYTFQNLSYSIDVYRGAISPMRNIVGFFNYVAYFPQLIAGPIDRAADLAPQLQRFINGQETRHVSAGLDRLALGIIQKLLIADSAGFIVDNLVATAEPSLISGWAIAVGFGLQIYYDFSAYTHMAIGMALLMGVRLPENFNSPYKARSIREFWQRWHITLSLWFRDYVYIPLGGSRHGSLRTVQNILITFLISGLWHGAGINFVLWGALHGTALATQHLLEATGRQLRLPVPVAVSLTFLFVHFAWIIFRVGDPALAGTLWSGMIGLRSLGLASISFWDAAFLSVFTVLTLTLPNAAQRWPGRSGWLESLLLWSGAVFAILSTPDVQQFIYFQF